MYTFEPTNPDVFVGLLKNTLVNDMNDLVHAPVADVVTNAKTAADLAAVAAEDVPKFLPQIYGNTYVVANELGKVGHNLATLSKNVDTVEKVAEFAKGRATTALLVGIGAGLGAYYLWKKYKAVEARVSALEGKK